jgi:hypothetical protein
LHIDGKDPVKLFEFKYKVFNLDKVPNAVGIVPPMLLVQNDKYVREASAPYEVGIVP